MQLPLFAKEKACISNGSSWYWLKDVATSNQFCYMGGHGSSRSYNAGEAYENVRTRFNLA